MSVPTCAKMPVVGVAKDFGDQLRSRAAGVLVFSVFIGAIDPESQGRIHAECHGVHLVAGFSAVRRQAASVKISIVATLAGATTVVAGSPRPTGT